MSTIVVPEGIDEAAVRRELLNEFSLEIGAGLGPLAGKVWRFGLMGYTAQQESVMLCLSALGSVLSRMGYPVKAGAAEAAAHKAYALHHEAAAQLLTQTA
jgi:alanine-glyoxylate transaminase/serine-glyoxylate transaminase/serine-pyruvate transaminase